MASENRVKPEEVAAIVDASEVTVEDRFGCMTVVHAKLPCGFVITETSACIDPANYSREIGTEICMRRIEDKVWELEGYHRMRSNHEEGKQHG